MPNITYYLGAGASADALPTNKRIDEKSSLSESLFELANELNSKENIDKVSQDCISEYQLMIENLKWLSKGGKKFNTVDVFAKYLYVKEEPGDLIKLKETLSFYFLYRQIINKKTDNRVLVFLTTLMEKGPYFPKEVKIISWNYDFQIQLAALNFMQEEITKGDNMHKALVPYYPHSFNGPESKEYSLVQLNGISGHVRDVRGGMRNLLMTKPLIDINRLITWNWEIKNSGIPTNLITFAWENNLNDKIGRFLHNESIPIAESFANKTNILVVIGYSFPFFNREFDRKIIEYMKRSGNLLKIYFQDKILTGEFLHEQFNIDDNFPIKHIEDCTNYFIPSEL